MSRRVVGDTAVWRDAALTAYLWSWAENQVMAALKAVPLGQAAGQLIGDEGYYDGLPLEAAGSC